MNLKKLPPARHLKSLLCGRECEQDASHDGRSGNEILESVESGHIVTPKKKKKKKWNFIWKSRDVRLERSRALSPESMIAKCSGKEGGSKASDYDTFAGNR